MQRIEFILAWAFAAWALLAFTTAAVAAPYSQIYATPGAIVCATDAVCASIANAQVQTVTFQGVVGSGVYVWDASCDGTPDAVIYIKPTGTHAGCFTMRGWSQASTPASTLAGVPGATADRAHGYNSGSLVVNTSTNTSPGTGRLYANLDPTNTAAKWVGLAYFDSLNNLWAGGSGGGVGVLTTGSGNTCLQNLTCRAITTGQDNFAGNIDNLKACTNCTNEFAGGRGALAAANHNNGDVAIGQDALGSIVTDPAFPNSWCAAYGNEIAPTATTCGSSGLFARACAFHATVINHVVCFGHGDLLFGDQLQNGEAIGDGASEAPVDGSDPTHFGVSTGDDQWSLIGGNTSKACGTALTNFSALAYNTVATCHSNAGTWGNGYQAVTISGTVWGKKCTPTVNAGAGTSLTAANIVCGHILRTVGAGAGFSDQLDTAANILAAGPGLGGEPAATVLDVTIQNNTAQIETITGNTGITVVGTATIPVGGTGAFTIQYSNTLTPTATFTRTNG